MALTELSVPVVYVDSIPYLWHRGDRVPSGVAAYLAQQPLVLPDHCWPVLRSISSLRWIEAIVPTGPDVPARVRRREGVVVNLGGLGSSARPAHLAPYPAVVLPPVLRALESMGHPVTVTCSPAGVESVRAVIDAASARVPVRVVALDHRGFLETLSAAQLLLTSPGLTTILEAGVVHVSTLLLPPQNLSQFVNLAVLEGLADAAVLHWPVETLRLPFIERCRAREAAEAVAHIDEQIGAAVGDRSVAERLHLDTIDTVRDLGARCVGSRLLDIVGRGGAAAVASTLMDTLHSR
jgi:hydroxymethylcytosylglucuronate/cytosylglucuronate synthase